MSTSSPTRHPALPRHGGDLAHAAARYGMPAGGWLDLSTGINPHAYPVPEGLAAAGLARLPDHAAEAALVAAARAAWSVPPSAGIALSPGTEPALRLLPLLLPPGPVAVLGPTYASHAEAWQAAGHAVAEVAQIAAIPADAAAVVLANPNNPDGRLLAPEIVADVAGRRRLVVVDEAFADLVPEASVVPHLRGTAPVVVLRSFGKFYGLPGLRLGFVVGDPALVGRVAALLGDWPVSAPALAIGRVAIADAAWQAATRMRLAAEASRLRAVLAAAGLKAAGGTDLYVLASDAGAAALHEALARRGIWTRIFAGQPEWIRFGLPPAETAFDRLALALAAVR